MARMLSEEQQGVVDWVGKGENVVCVAKPGTGKTTVALACAKVCGKTLVLTYNRKLKESTRERVCAMKLDRLVEVHSYHAAAQRFFVPDAETNDDTLLHTALTRTTAPIEVSLVVIDEAQDLSELYVDFVKHLLRHTTTTPTLLIVGDPFQSIFGYLGANPRYMLSPERWLTGTFRRMHLTTCWRITPEMALWINTHLHPRHLESVAPEWWSERGAELLEVWGVGIRAGKPSVPGSVAILPIDDPGVHMEIRETLSEFDSQDCAFLCKSVRRANMLLANMVDKCSSANWLVTHDSPWDPPDSLTHGKAVLTTIHRFKGLERPFVCVVGLDAQWERTAADPMELFCLYFVALTRATQKMLVLVGDPPYATLRRTPLPPCARRKMIPTVSTLLRHAPFCRVLSVPKSPEHPDGAVSRTVVTQNRGIDAARIDAARLLPGRGGTTEDAAPYLDKAVEYFVRRLLDIPLTDVTDGILESRAPPAVKAWVRSEPEWTSSNLFCLAVATHSASTLYAHYWRQVVAHPRLIELLDACAKTVAGLLQTLGMTFGACAPWVTAVDPFAEHYEPAIEVKDTPLVSADGKCVVFMVTAPVLRHDAVLHAATVAALRSLDAEHPVRCVLVHTNEATLYEVETRDPADLVARVATRK